MNAKNSGRTPVAGMVHAVVILLVLLFLMPYAGLSPMPAIDATAMNSLDMTRWVQTISTHT